MQQVILDLVDLLSQESPSIEELVSKLGVASEVPRDELIVPIQPTDERFAKAEVARSRTDPSVPLTVEQTLAEIGRIDLRPFAAEMDYLGMDFNPDALDGDMSFQREGSPEAPNDCTLSIRTASAPEGSEVTVRSFLIQRGFRFDE